MKIQYLNLPPLAGIRILAFLLVVAVWPANAGSPEKPGGKTDKKEEKAPPLSFANGKVTFDIEERTRFEARENNRDFNDAVDDPSDDAWLLNRFRFGAAVKPESWLKFYAQTQDIREWDSERIDVPGVGGAEGDDPFDLRQAYFQLANYKEFPLGLTAGRQILSYGDQRLVADSRWGNFGRTFDAVKLRYETKEFWTDAFVSRPVQIKNHAFNDSDAADTFYGLYGSTSALKFQTTELYFLYRDKEDNQPDLDPTNRRNPLGSWNGPAQRVATIGTRWKSGKDLHGWDYTFEGAIQFGEVWTGSRSTARLDHHAHAIHASGGYTWKDATWSPRIGVAYNYATGDDNPLDGRNQSFQNLFPSNHAKFGDMDEFGWRNLHHLRVPLTVKPVKKVELELAYNADWLDDTHDYWYRGNGFSTLRTRTPDGRDVRLINADNFAGHELDVIARWKPRDWLNLEAGYAHFFAGDYLRDTGPADDADFGYVSAQVLF